MAWVSVTQHRTMQSSKPSDFVTDSLTRRLTYHCAQTLSEGRGKGGLNQGEKGEGWLRSRGTGGRVAWIKGNRGDGGLNEGRSVVSESCEEEESLKSPQSFARLSCWKVQRCTVHYRYEKLDTLRIIRLLRVCTSRLVLNA